MDSSDGQSKRPAQRGPGSQATRRRLLRAAAELIAELGWGRVTTRAVAARAGLPHGAVSYHFRGKQDLLIEAALDTFEQAFPLAALKTLTGFVELLELWLGEEHEHDPIVSAVGMEAMLECERDPVLRARMAATLRDYRRALTEVLQTPEQLGSAPAAVSPEALATLLVAVGDGLFLHARLDPQLDGAGALAALKALLAASS
jgi:AcrR family transcriptional regulator